MWLKVVDKGCSCSLLECPELDYTSSSVIPASQTRSTAVPQLNPRRFSPRLDPDLLTWPERTDVSKTRALGSSIGGPEKISECGGRPKRWSRRENGRRYGGGKINGRRLGMVASDRMSVLRDPKGKPLCYILALTFELTFFTRNFSHAVGSVSGHNITVPLLV